MVARTDFGAHFSQILSSSSSTWFGEPEDGQTSLVPARLDCITLLNSAAPAMAGFQHASDVLMGEGMCSC